MWILKVVLISVSILKLAAKIIFRYDPFNNSSCQISFLNSDSDMLKQRQNDQPPLRLLTWEGGGCCCSVAKSCPALCDTVYSSIPGLPSPHPLPELTQVHIHWIGHVIQPSHPLPPSSFAFSLSQQQGLFKRIDCSHQVDKVLELQLQLQLQLQHQSFQWISRADFPLGLMGLISLLSKGFSRVFSSTTVQKHQFFGIQPSLCPTLTYVITTWKTIALTIWTIVGKVMSLFFNVLSRFVMVFLPRN